MQKKGARLAAIGLLVLILTVPSSRLAAQQAPIPADSPGTPQSFQRDPWLTGIHLGLGWATLATGLATGALSPERAGLGVHQTLGYTTAALAAATMAFGIWAHWGEVGPAFSWDDPNNIHAALGAVGGTMMMIAPFVAPSELHKVLGEAGWMAMGVSVAWKIVF